MNKKDNYKVVCYNVECPHSTSLYAEEDTYLSNCINGMLCEGYEVVSVTSTPVSINNKARLEIRIIYKKIQKCNV